MMWQDSGRRICGFRLKARAGSASQIYRRKFASPRQHRSLSPRSPTRVRKTRSRCGDGSRPPGDDFTTPQCRCSSWPDVTSTRPLTLEGRATGQYRTGTKVWVTPTTAARVMSPIGSLNAMAKPDDALLPDGRPSRWLARSTDLLGQSWSGDCKASATMGIICRTFSLDTCKSRERTDGKAQCPSKTAEIDCGHRLSFARQVWAAYLVKPVQSYSAEVGRCCLTELCGRGRL